MPPLSPRKPTRAVQLGVTDDDYARMLAAQGGRCAIPGCSRTPKTRRFHVDHDHKTGQVRGLLCHLHNRFLPSTSADALAMAKYLGATWEDFRNAAPDPRNTPLDNSPAVVLAPRRNRARRWT